jgi:hypothetical protein
VLACKGIIKEPFAVINADDYYGKEAFVRLHDFLQGYTPDKPGDLAMAGFVLKNTLSDNGAVTRGICQMNDAHYLTCWRPAALKRPPTAQPQAAKASTSTALFR